MESDPPPVTVLVRYKTTDPDAQPKAAEEAFQVDPATSVKNLLGLIRQKYSAPDANVTFYREGRAITIDRSDRKLLVEDLVEGLPENEELVAEIDDLDETDEKGANPSPTESFPDA